MKNRSNLTIFTTILAVLTCFAFLPQMQAACAPVDGLDGVLANLDTAEGFNALSWTGVDCAGAGNTGVGWFSLFTSSDNFWNTGVGAGTLVINFANNNTATGAGAMLFNVLGFSNTANGAFALFQSQLASDNTAIGDLALFNNDRLAAGLANANTAVGSSALTTNLDGAANTAVGNAALVANLVGDANTAVGDAALLLNGDSGNTGVGAFALLLNTAGLSSPEGPNTAVGLNALLLNTTGHGNVAVGADELPGLGVLGANTIGSANTGVGQHVLRSNVDGIWNTAVGAASLLNNVTGDFNTAVGVQAGINITGNSNIDIGQGVFGVAGENNTIRIGSNLPTGVGASRAFMGGIFNQVPTAGSHTVVVGPDNHLADFTLSSRRFKKDIAPIDKISEGILALKPVTFHWKTDTTNKEPEFGLVAEEVAEVNPDWATRDPQGEISGVRYEAIPILLLNEFLKEHKKVEQQQASISQLKSEMQTMVAQLKEQAAQIQKVSAQLEVSKPAPQVVTNKP
jgi:hypothetical protein